MRTIVVATKNEHKLNEIKSILSPLDIEILSLKDINIDIDIDEDKDTFYDNAKKKACEIMKLCNLPTLADDSGLVVDALNGEPGVFSARYSGVHGDDKSNNLKLLNNLKKVSYEKRTARFIAALYLAVPNGESFYTEGIVEGIIGFEEAGSGGFGYDPLFIVPEYNKTFAELSNSEKNKISHRSRALEKMKAYLKDV